MALQWLKPVDYDCQEALARLPDTSISIRELLPHAPTCPIAAVSLHLDWTLIQGKPKAKLQFLRGVSGNTPTPMPVLDTPMALPEQVVKDLFEAERVKRANGRSVRLKTRGLEYQPCDDCHPPSKCFNHQLEMSELPPQGGRADAQLIRDDQDKAKGPAIYFKEQLVTDGPQHDSKASFQGHDAATFFLQLAQNAKPAQNEPGHLSGNQHGRKPSPGNTRSTAIPVDLPASHQSILCEIKDVCDALCQEVSIRDKTVLGEALLCTTQLDSAIQELANDRSPNPDQIALMKAYAALAVLKQTAICIAQHGLSCAYMVRSSHIDCVI